ncbi:hypothetical protein [Sutcliffiella rhizosphaerae]|uniref:Uncharacterized protein n=1 Tax=Sutcliffiella rhizosphaerae TaxID=2880967 RepID=A0ABN8AA73_9BACI|nr:hypothetical protein [Sutcliffiella rhizosphaerae]CAG9620912.1 hypothetical protein BACCIP111883_01684 [Sutcliffiella rhizosphaerae]
MKKIIIGSALGVILAIGGTSVFASIEEPTLSEVKDANIDFSKVQVFEEQDLKIAGEIPKSVQERLAGQTTSERK